MAFLLLRVALYREYGLGEVPKIITAERGKPYFESVNDLFFNLSHCEKGAVCAVSRREIGIDIHDARDTDKRTMERVLCPEEIDFVKKSDDRKMAFAYLWSRKEALAKKDGCGVSAVLNKINTLDNGELSSFDGGDFYISLASGGEINIITLTIMDIESCLKELGRF